MLNHRVPARPAPASRRHSEDAGRRHHAHRGLRLGNPGHLDIHSRAHIAEIASECERQGVSVVSIHSPGFLYNSEDEDNRKNAVAEGIVAAKVAEEMGAGVMVCHFQTEEQSEKSITEMLDRLEGYSIKLAIENGRDLADYTTFVDKIGSDRFGMVVDIGHTRDEDEVNPFIKEDRARETMAQCGERLIHLHLHDWVNGITSRHWTAAFSGQRCSRPSTTSTIRACSCSRPSTPRQRRVSYRPTTCWARSHHSHRHSWSDTSRSNTVSTTFRMPFPRRRRFKRAERVHLAARRAFSFLWPSRPSGRRWQPAGSLA